MEVTMKKVDLRGVESSERAWAEARDAVTASMLAYGCVVVKHDDGGAACRAALFGRAMPELRALPLEAKLRNVGGDMKHGGYLYNRRGMATESLRVPDVTHAQLIADFTNLLWPEGNPAFCDTIAEFSKNTIKLEQTVIRMLLEGLGVGSKEAAESQQGLAAYSTRLSFYYGDAPFIPVHRDFSMTTTVVQHQVDGLEVQHQVDGSWSPVPPEPDTCTIIAGDLLTVITNGRVQSCIHRVSPPSNRERLSALLTRMPNKGGGLLRPMEELVDHLHPAMYHPCDPYKYCDFKYTEEGVKAKDPLQAFCGVAAPAAS